MSDRLDRIQKAVNPPDGTLRRPPLFEDVMWLINKVEGIVNLREAMCCPPRRTTTKWAALLGRFHDEALTALAEIGAPNVRAVVEEVKRLRSIVVRAKENMLLRQCSQCGHLHADIHRCHECGHDHTAEKGEDDEPDRN